MSSSIWRFPCLERYPGVGIIQSWETPNLRTIGSSSWIWNDEGPKLGREITWEITITVVLGGRYILGYLLVNQKVKKPQSTTRAGRRSPQSFLKFVRYRCTGGFSTSQTTLSPKWSTSGTVPRPSPSTFKLEATSWRAGNFSASLNFCGRKVKSKTTQPTLISFHMLSSTYNQHGLLSFPAGFFFPHAKGFDSSERASARSHGEFKHYTIHWCHLVSMLLIMIRGMQKLYRL